MQATYEMHLERFVQQAQADAWDIVKRVDYRVTWQTFLRHDVLLPEQGWKIHVSFTVDEAIAFISNIIPQLKLFGASFKVAANQTTIDYLNEGKAGAAQVGKCLTVYPRNDGECRKIANFIIRSWPTGMGPRLVSDVAISPQGHVGLRYGAFAGERFVIDPVGRFKPAIVDPNGSLAEDLRTVDGKQPDWAPPPPVSPVRHTGRQLPIRVGASSFVPLAILQTVPKGDVRMALQTDAPYTLAFVKTAKRGITSTGNGFTTQQLLCREYEIQQSLFEKGFPCAEPLALIEDVDETCVVSKDLEGEPLTSSHFSESRHLIPDLLRLVATLHGLGFVHRDLKPSNIIRTDIGLKLIDFELAADIGETCAPSAGTDGFCPPDRTDSTLFRDYFALGGIITWAWLGMSHTTAKENAKFLDLNDFTGPAKWTLELATDNTKNIDLNALAARIERYPTDICRTTPVLGASVLMPGHSVSATVQQLAAFADIPNEGELRWKNMRREGDTYNEGLARGTAGVVLALMTLEETSGTQCFELIAPACNWLASRPKYASSPGLFTGNAGVSIVLAVAARRYNIDAWQTASESYFQAAMNAPLVEADLYFGASGLLWTATLLDAVEGQKNYSEAARPIVHWLLQRLDRTGPVWFWPNNGTLTADAEPYLGAAHGVAGTAMALGAWSRVVGDATLQHLHDELFLRLFKHTQTHDGRQLVANIGAEGEANPPHVWCHGVGGYLWCLLQHPAPSPILHDAIRWGIARVLHAPVAGNATYCHGLSGRLELLRMSQNWVDCDTAIGATVEAIQLLKKTSSNGCVWSCETPDMISPELWTGSLSPVSALAMQQVGSASALLSSSWLTRLTNAKVPYAD